MTPEERRRWSDDRTDERFATVERQINELKAKVARMDAYAERFAVMDSKLADVAEDTRECLKGFESLRTTLLEQERTRRQEREAEFRARERAAKDAVDEKKKAQLQVFGLVIGASAVIVAAVSVLLGVLG